MFIRWMVGGVRSCDDVRSCGAGSFRRAPGPRPLREYYMSRVLPPDGTPPSKRSIELPPEGRGEDDELDTILVDDTSSPTPRGGGDGRELVEQPTASPVAPAMMASAGEKAASTTMSEVSSPMSPRRALSKSKSVSFNKKRTRSSRRLFGRSNTGEGEEILIHLCEVAVETLEPKSVFLTLDTSGQHTLSWDVPLRLSSEPSTKSSTLPAGSCNLYLFPSFKPEGESSPCKPTPAQLGALRALFVGMASHEGCELCAKPDSVGAFPIHAITVANTDEAVSLAEAMVVARPSLLLQPHVKVRANGLALFTGETTLHIACVNRREALLCRLLDVMMERLPREDARSLLLCQASGAFFHVMPMRTFGGTPLAYACCFELRDAVRRILDTGLVSLNQREEGTCVLTGFLPIHAVVANGLRSMYDFLTEELPEAQRAGLIPSGVGKLKLDSYGLSPMQLSAKLGDHEMVKHIMKKQTTILWGA